MVEIEQAEEGSGCVLAFGGAAVLWFLIHPNIINQVLGWEREILDASTVAPKCQIEQKVMRLMKWVFSSTCGSSIDRA